MTAVISPLEIILLIAIGIACVGICTIIAVKTFKKKGKPNQPEEEEREE